MPGPGPFRTTNANRSGSPAGNRSAEPEILRPRVGRGADLFSDGNLDMLSHILDDFLRIPGTNIRFGLDGIIGLVPVVGDVLGAMASWIIILAAWLRGVPKVTLARMLANVAIETIVGAVPILGDAFDIAWKANRRNFALLQRSTASAHPAPNASGYAAPARPAGRQAATPTYAGPNTSAYLRLGPSPKERHRHALSDWFFLGGLVVAMMLLVAIPIALLAFLVGKFFALGMRR